MDSFAEAQNLALNQNYPNPFNPGTTIEYELPETADVKLSIYNLQGQQVATLVAQRQTASHYATQWDGRNTSGTRVASGIYIYRIQAGEYSQFKKLTLMR